MAKLNDNPIRLKMTIISSFNPGYIRHEWSLRLENFKEHYLEWDKRIKAMIKKDLENGKQGDFRGIPYTQFMDELHNKMCGSLIVSIYTDVEFDLFTILGKSLSKSENIKKEFLKKYQIDLSSIKKYKEIDKLRRYNNCFKHNANVPRNVKAIYCISWGNTKEIDYRKIDIPTVLKDCQIFFDDLKEQINIKMNATKEK